MEWSGIRIGDPLLLPCWPWHGFFLGRVQSIRTAPVGDAVYIPLLGHFPMKIHRRCSVLGTSDPLMLLQRQTLHMVLCWQTVLLFTVVVWCLQKPSNGDSRPSSLEPPFVWSRCNFQGTSLDVISTWGFLVILILIHCSVWYRVLHNKTQYQLDVSMRKNWKPVLQGWAV